MFQGRTSQTVGFNSSSCNEEFRCGPVCISNPEASRNGGAEGTQCFRERRRLRTASSCLSRTFREFLDILAFYEGIWRFLCCALLSLVVFVNAGFSDVRCRCLYVLTLMVSCWLLSSLSPYVVSLLPVVLFPLLKVEPIGFVAASYADSASFLILGASMMVTALERAELDVELAKILRSFAPSETPLLALYLMFISFLSASFLSSIGTMLLICPVVELLRGGQALERRSVKVASGAIAEGLEFRTGEEADPTAVVTEDSSEERLFPVEKTLNSTSPGSTDTSQEPRKVDDSPERLEERRDFEAGSRKTRRCHTATGHSAGKPASARAVLKKELMETASVLNLEELEGSRGSAEEAEAEKAKDAGEGEDIHCSKGSLVEGTEFQRRSTKASGVCESSCECLSPSNSDIHGAKKRKSAETERLLLFTGCSYAATIGASLTLTSSGANAVFLSTLETLYAGLSPSRTNPITFMTWMLLSIPVGFAQLFAVWFTLVASSLGTKSALKASLCCSKAFCRTLARAVRASYKALASLASCVQRRLSRKTQRGGVAEEDVSRSQRETVRSAEPRQLPTIGKKGLTLPGRAKLLRNSPAPCFLARAYVVAAWIVLALLWITRRTIVSAIPGWGTYFGDFVDDAWPAMLVPISFFFVPLHARSETSSIVRLTRRSMELARRCFPRRRKESQGELRVGSWRGLEAFEEAKEETGAEAEEDACHYLEGDVLAASRSSNTVLTFPVVQETMDWGLLLLVGSGFSLAAVTRKCGLQALICQQLTFLESLSPLASVACILAITSVATQLASGTSVASIIIPLFSAACNSSQPKCPLRTLLPTIMGIHLGFLLPISSSSNAVLVRYTKLKMSEFFTRGLIVLVVCYAVTYGLLVSYAEVLFSYL